MTRSTGQRTFHFKNTKPADSSLKPFADWLPVNQKFLATSERGLKTAATAKAQSSNIAAVFGWLSVGWTSRITISIPPPTLTRYGHI